MSVQETKGRAINHDCHRKQNSKDERNPLWRTLACIASMCVHILTSYRQRLCFEFEYLFSCSIVKLFWWLGFQCYWELDDLKHLLLCLSLCLITADILQALILRPSVLCCPGIWLYHPFLGKFTQFCILEYRNINILSSKLSNGNTATYSNAFWSIGYSLTRLGV